MGVTSRRDSSHSHFWLKSPISHSGISEEKALTWQKAKTGFAYLTSRDAWRRLAQGMAIVFLLTHQAWGGIICHCQHEDSTQQISQTAHACCHDGHHSGVAEGVPSVSEPVHSPASCSEESTPGSAVGQRSEGQLGALPQGEMVCCQAAPQAEVQGITIPSQDPVPVINTQPSVKLAAPAAFVPTYQNFHQLHRARPLYLSISCFLI